MYVWILWEVVAVILGFEGRIVGTAGLYVYRLTFSLKPQILAASDVTTAYLETAL
jgi:hypothetical protein